MHNYGFHGNADGRIKATANWWLGRIYELGETMLQVSVSCLINCVSVRFQQLFLVGAAKTPQDFDRRCITSELASIKSVENNCKGSI